MSTSDVRQRIAELVGAPDDDTLVIAGKRLPAAGEARAWRERLIEQLGRRFVERRPNASEHTWHRFASQLKEYAKELEKPSDEMLRHLYVLIDGL